MSNKKSVLRFVSVLFSLKSWLNVKLNFKKLKIAIFDTHYLKLYPRYYFIQVTLYSFGAKIAAMLILGPLMAHGKAVTARSGCLAFLKLKLFSVVVTTLNQEVNVITKFDFAIDLN